jgi:hypothetical protein
MVGPVRWPRVFCRRIEQRKLGCMMQGAGQRIAEGSEYPLYQQG